MYYPLDYGLLSYVIMVPYNPTEEVISRVSPIFLWSTAAKDSVARPSRLWVGLLPSERRPGTQNLSRIRGLGAFDVEAVWAV